MKNSLLIALLWATSLLHTAAQKALPPSLQPHAAHWHHTVVKALHRAGYQMPTMQHNNSVASSGIQQRSNALQLDSTKTFYGYGLPTSADSTPLYRTTYHYPQPNTEIEYSFQYENGAWQQTSRSTQLHDAQGQLTEVFAEVFNPMTNSFQPESRLESFPHNGSSVLLDSFFVWQWDTTLTTWSLIINNRNFYDAQDRLLESYSTLELFGELITFKDVHSYDSKGDNHLIESYGILSGFEYLTSKRELVYQDHLVTESTAFITDENGKIVPQNKIEYAYTDFQKEEWVKNYEWSPEKSDWTQTGEITYHYDSAKRMIAQEKHFLHQDAPEEHVKWVYAYREDDLPAMEESYNWDDNSSFLLSDRKYYYYSGGSSTVKQPAHAAQPLAMTPNPTSGALQLGLQVPANIQIFDISGQQLRTGSFQPEYALNLHDLPSGLYIIVARTDHEVFTGKVVKE